MHDQTASRSPSDEQSKVWLDLGNNHLWNSEDLNVLTTRARNVTSLILRGNRKWLAKSKFYAPILVKRLASLTRLDGIEVTPRMRARYRVVGCRLNARAVRRRGKLYGDAAQSASEIVEFSLEDESLRKVELCGEFDTLIVAYLMNNCLKSIKSFGVTCRHLRHLSVEGNAMIRFGRFEFAEGTEIPQRAQLHDQNAFPILVQAIGKVTLHQRRAKRTPIAKWT